LLETPAVFSRISVLVLEVEVPTVAVNHVALEAESVAGAV
jgi:hypothetical protein